jgi:hypothetical protein
MSTVRNTWLDRSWLWFGAWALVGAGWCLALLSLLTVGVFVAPVMALLTALLLRGLPRGSGQGAPGLLSGPSLTLFYIAWLNRGGPGDVCTSDGSTCTDEWSPVPWLVAGSVLLVAGAMLFLLVRRQARRSPAGPPAGLRFTA